MPPGVLQLEHPDTRIGIKAAIAVQLFSLTFSRPTVRMAARMPPRSKRSACGQERLCQGAEITRLRRLSVGRSFCIGIPVLFLLQLARPAGAQVDDPVPHATLDPRSITLPIVDGADIRFRRLST